MPLNVKMILPALTEAKSPFFRPIKYSLFPPLGLATLAGYLDDSDVIDLQDEHVESPTSTMNQISLSSRCISPLHSGRTKSRTITGRRVHMFALAGCT